MFFLGSALGYLIAMCSPGVGKFGCIWLEWFACGQGIWRQIFEKGQIPTPCPAIPPPLPSLIGASVVSSARSWTRVILARKCGSRCHFVVTEVGKTSYQMLKVLFRHQLRSWRSGTRERMQRMRQISCVVLALKKAGFYRCRVLLYCFVDIQDTKIHRRTS